jgi:hypothetical protein
MSDNRRIQLLDAVKREMIGPDPINWPGYIQENGEEILTTDPPLKRYIAGILYPEESTETEILDEEIVPDLEEEDDSDRITVDFIDDNRTVHTQEMMEESEELINRSNAYLPSAMSFTAALHPEDKIRIAVEAGVYIPATVLVQKETDFNGMVKEVKIATDEGKKMVSDLNSFLSENSQHESKDELKNDSNKTEEQGDSDKEKIEEKENVQQVTYYFRKQIHWDNDNREIDLPSADQVSTSVENEDGLKLTVTFRYKMNDLCIYTFTLGNNKKKASKALRDTDCFFQVSMKIFSQLLFKPLPENKRISINNSDYWSNLLLYRDIKNYAIGHGCATIWDQSEGGVRWISTATFPSYEMKPILPSEIRNVSLEMYKMSDAGDFPETVKELKLMCSEYKDWIEKLKVKAGSLEKKFHDTAYRHVKNCEECHARMVNGVNLLESDNQVRTAFGLMNRAMLLQQLRYNLPLQKWVFDVKGGISLEDPVKVLPRVEDPSTWHNSNNRIYGRWRPFQLAFILMNLESMKNEDSDERKIVDLIWFPTGGGKTEAYLGLSAYTIFLRRIKDKQASGTSILMRYTLRLLTAQQYERAASMICACESIRKDNPELLGDDRITIGLWVGRDTSPNSMQEALNKYHDLLDGKGANPFVMLKCPWCGAQMGIVEESKSSRYGNRYLPGYRKVIGKHRSQKIIFQCNNSDYGCSYSTDDNPLPLTVIDEEIYENPPSLLLGTVDKFARLPFEPRSQSLFGFVNGEKRSSIDLIIQDELHLISGPLGSMVGHYETMIQELSSYKSDSGKIYPKIIASTATISRASEQCHALYACGTEKVFQFPPSGLDAGDSFFAYEDKSAKGRLYVGIMAMSDQSDVTTIVRLYSSLLYGAKNLKVDIESQRDPYWTNVGYYNSLRELGQAATLIQADIEHHLDSIYKREHFYEKYKKDERYDHRRYIFNTEELTSRIRNDRITESLANLSISYPQPKNEKGYISNRPIDICLATNMISVGLDVPRLGLMTIAGQPKTTSEYIQASSRIGRDNKSAPGIVFVQYRPGRPRDRSHYEHFISYHSRIYANVEPTSVTPFSSRVRDRALHAVLVGILRLQKDNEYNQSKPFVPNEVTQESLRKIISERVKAIDPRELEDTLERINYIFDRWDFWRPELWCAKYTRDGSFDHPVPLIYGAGQEPHTLWDGRGLETPNSMRNVDSSCEVSILSGGYGK